MNIYIDIETIPGDTRPNEESVKVPANYKDPDKIKAYQKEHLDEEYRHQSLDSMAGKILCIGYACENGAIECTFGQENEILRGFEEYLIKVQGAWSEPVTFVGWNINAFDIPWIWRKAIKYGLTSLRNSFNRSRYKGNSIDLMLAWATDYKNYTKMEDVAQFLGLPGKIGGLTGATVYDAYLEGKVDEISAYCKGDVSTVREIYKRVFETEAV
jgi:3'-5' exonuclease